MPSGTRRFKGLRRVHKPRKTRRISPQRNNTTALRIRAPVNKKNNKNLNWGKTPALFHNKNLDQYDYYWLRDILNDMQDYETPMSNLMLEARSFLEDWMTRYEKTKGQIPNYLLHNELPAVHNKDERDLISYILFALSNLTQEEYELILHDFFPNLYDYLGYGSSRKN